MYREGWGVFGLGGFGGGGVIGPHVEMGGLWIDRYPRRDVVVVVMVVLATGWDSHHLTRRLEGFDGDGGGGGSSSGSGNGNHRDNGSGYGLGATLHIQTRGLRGSQDRGCPAAPISFATARTVSQHRVVVGCGLASPEGGRHAQVRGLWWSLRETTTPSIPCSSRCPAPGLDRRGGALISHLLTSFSSCFHFQERRRRGPPQQQPEACRVSGALLQVCFSLFLSCLSFLA